jgi:lysophospholipase L1-like esterase
MVNQIYQKGICMKLFYRCLALSVLFFAVTSAAQTRENPLTINGKSVFVPQWMMDSKVKHYRAMDEQSAPEKGGIVFAGSSTIEKWTASMDGFAPLEIINRGVGGSTTLQWLYLCDPLILTYEPKLVVFFCGTNDLGNNGTPAQAEAVLDNTRYILNRIFNKLPECRVIYLSVTKAPSRKGSWAAMDKVNEQMKALAESDPRITYYDMNPMVFTADGEADETKYESDKLHLCRAAYVQLTQDLKPQIEALLQ